MSAVTSIVINQSISLDEASADIKVLFKWYGRFLTWRSINLAVELEGPVRQELVSVYLNCLDMPVINELKAQGSQRYVLVMLKMGPVGWYTWTAFGHVRPCSW